MLVERWARSLLMLDLARELWRYAVCVCKFTCFLFISYELIFNFDVSTSAGGFEI